MNIDQSLALAGFLAAFIVGMVQQMYPTIPKYIGWPIIIISLIVSSIFVLPSLVSIQWEIAIISILAIIAIVLFFYYWRKRNSPDSRVRIFQPFRRNQTNKEKAHVIHQKIMELEAKFWKIKDSLTATEDSQKNVEIKRLVNELLFEFNELGHLVNNKEFDEWSESFMSLYSRYLEFHMDVHDEKGVWSRTRLNSKLRHFVNKVKG